MRTIEVMGQIKRLSANDIMRITGVSGRQCKKIMWHASEVVVKNVLSINEFVDVVNAIVHDCSGDDMDKSFMLLDFAFRVNVIDAYAYVELPQDIETLYYVIYASDLFETIYKRTNQAQIDAIFESVRLVLQTGRIEHEQR